MRKKITLALLSLLLVPLAMMAQNVTVRGDNGSVLAARKTASSGTLTDTFYKWGGFATWKHNQLSLTMTTADSDDGSLRDGQIANPANNIFKNGNVLQLGCGIDVDTYIAFSLPKGYRFTGYTIVFARDIDHPTSYSSAEAGTVAGAEFGETNSSWAWYDNDTHYTGIDYSANNAPEYTIKRTGTADEMGNMLYFKFTSPHGHGTTSYRAFLSLRSIEFTFTAEADYTPIVAETHVSGASAVDIPFSTNKVDYGRLASKTYSTYSARMGYDSDNVTDLKANMTLYEKESLTDSLASDPNPFDGTIGKRVKYETSGHSIYSAGEYFKIGGKKDGDDYVEQIYYLESPNYVEVPDGTGTYKNPIGYRIVGAKIEATKSYNAETEFYIVYELNGQKYYFTTSYGAFSTTTQTKWVMDSDGYIHSGSNYIYNNGGWAETITNKNNALQFEIVEDGIRVKGTENYLQMYNYSGTYYGIIYGETDEAYKTVPEYLTPSTAVGDFELYVYDKTGKKKVKTLAISDSKKTDSWELNDLNNDAVKIGIKGVGLFKGTVTLQALDPYIDRLDIVCQQAATDAAGNVTGKATQGSKVTQRFTATDFSVKGGKFNFYVPENFKFPCIYTFEQLYSKYGDKSYYDGSTDGNARYNFVMSPYWQGTTNVYQTNPDHTYLDKIWTEKVGKVKFKFNNAEDFSANNPQAGIYKEYPFNPATYGDGNINPVNNFHYFYFTETEMTSGEEKTAYLFTCDETRYNIAPTTGIQHTAYAYYQMDITMVRHNYSPDFKWKKVYKESCYQDADGKLKTDAQWGLELLTDNIGTTAKPEYGYLTVQQITEEIAKQAKAGATNAPTSKDLILYVDGSKLQSIVENQAKTGEGTSAQVKEYKMSDIVSGLGKNALVYLPEGTTSNVDNFAYKTVGGTFRSANNIVLTDMNPFYAPYNITMADEKTVTYDRKVTVPKNGKVTSATIIMPFEIDLTNAPFTLHQMQAENCLKDGEDGADPEIYFPNLGSDNPDTRVTKAEANTPYLVKVTNPGSGDNVTFSLSQGVKEIIATTDMVSETDDDEFKYTFEGETASGTKKNGPTYTFVHHGSFSGKQLVKTGNYFFFSKNMFLLSNDYAYNAPIKIAPFRTYYSSESTGGDGGAKLAAFDIIFGEGMGNEPDGINSLTHRADLMVTSGKGTITMASTIDQDVRVNSLNGMLINNVSLQSGEMHTINVPTGIYVVNGVKIIVK